MTGGRFEYEADRGGSLVRAINAVGRFLYSGKNPPDLVVDADQSELSVGHTDAANVGIITAHVPRADADHVSVRAEDTGRDGKLAMPAAVVKHIRNDVAISDPLTVEYDGETWTITSDGDTETFDGLSLADIRRPPDYPDMDLPVETTINADDLKTVSRLVDNHVSERIQLGANDGEVFLHAEGDIADLHATPPQETDGRETVASLYSMRYFYELVYGVPGPSSTDVTLTFGDEFPVEVEYPLYQSDGGYVEAAIAPRIAEDGINPATSFEATPNPAVEIDAMPDNLARAVAPMQMWDHQREARIHIRPDGLETAFVDAANVAMTNVSASPDAFEDYRLTDAFPADGHLLIGADTERLYNVTDDLPDDPATFQIDTNTRKYSLTAGWLTYQDGLIDPDAIRQEPSHPSGIGFTGEIETTTAEWFDLPNEVDDSDAEVVIGSDGETGFRYFETATGELDDDDDPPEPDDYDHTVVIRDESTDDTEEYRVAHVQTFDDVRGGMYGRFSGDYLHDVDVYPWYDKPDSRLLASTAVERPVVVRWRDLNDHLKVHAMISPRINKNADGVSVGSLERDAYEKAGIDADALANLDNEGRTLYDSETIYPDAPDAETAADPDDTSAEQDGERAGLDGYAALDIYDALADMAGETASKYPDYPAIDLPETYNGYDLADHELDHDRGFDYIEYEGEAAGTPPAHMDRPTDVVVRIYSHGGQHAHKWSVETRYIERGDDREKYDRTLITYNHGDAADNREKAIERAKTWMHHHPVGENRDESDADAPDQVGEFHRQNVTSPDTRYRWATQSGIHTVVKVLKEPDFRDDGTEWTVHYALEGDGEIIHEAKTLADAVDAAIEWMEAFSEKESDNGLPMWDETPADNDDDEYRVRLELPRSTATKSQLHIVNEEADGWRWRMVHVGPRRSGITHELRGLTKDEAFSVVESFQRGDSEEARAWLRKARHENPRKDTPREAAQRMQDDAEGQTPAETGDDSDAAESAESASVVEGLADGADIQRHRAETIVEAFDDTETDVYAGREQYREIDSLDALAVAVGAEGGHDWLKSLDGVGSVTASKVSQWAGQRRRDRDLLELSTEARKRKKRKEHESDADDAPDGAEDSAAQPADQPDTEDSETTTSTTMTDYPMKRGPRGTLRPYDPDTGRFVSAPSTDDAGNDVPGIPMKKGPGGQMRPYNPNTGEYISREAAERLAGSDDPGEFDDTNDRGDYPTKYTNYGDYQPYDPTDGSFIETKQGDNGGRVSWTKGPYGSLRAYDHGKGHYISFEEAERRGVSPPDGTEVIEDGNGGGARAQNFGEYDMTSTAFAENRADVAADRHATRHWEQQTRNPDGTFGPKVAGDGGGPYDATADMATDGGEDPRSLWDQMLGRDREAEKKAHLREVSPEEAAYLRQEYSGVVDEDSFRVTETGGTDDEDKPSSREFGEAQFEDTSGRRAARDRMDRGMSAFVPDSESHSFLGSSEETTVSEPVQKELRQANDPIAFYQAKVDEMMEKTGMTEKQVKGLLGSPDEVWERHKESKAEPPETSSREFGDPAEPDDFEQQMHETKGQSVSADEWEWGADEDTQANGGTGRSPGVPDDVDDMLGF